MPEQLANSINHWAVLVAVAASFMLGGLCYSPALFGRVWCSEVGRSMDEGSGQPAKVFGFAIAFSIVVAHCFAWLLGPAPGLHHALHTSLVVGVGFVACCFGTNYQSAGHGWKLFGMDAGYHLLQLVLFALVLGLWH